jgi:hypothetical protein
MFECECLVLYIAQREGELGRLRYFIFTRRKRHVLDVERERDTESEYKRTGTPLGMGCGGDQADCDDRDC